MNVRCPHCKSIDQPRPPLAGVGPWFTRCDYCCSAYYYTRDRRTSKDDPEELLLKCEEEEQQA